MSEHISAIRSWPEGVEKRGTARTLIAAYRAAFDADPCARFCAGEFDGITLVIAVGRTAERVQRFVINELGGEIEREVP